MKPAAKCIDRLAKEHRKWLAKTAPRVFNWAEQSLAADLDESSLASLRSMKSSLGSFGIFYGTRGGIALLDGNATALDDIYLGASFHLHELLLKYALWIRFPEETGFTLAISKVACALCFSVTNGLYDWSRLFAKMLGEAEWNGQMVDRSFWQERKFEPFALALWRIDCNRGLVGTAGADSLGIYSGIIDSWDSPDLLCRALELACDYHCENMEIRNDDWEAEFRDPPFDLIPWELLAIRQIRQRLGLSTPFPPHPLLEPLGNFASRSELPLDERINSVERLRRELALTVND